jgi:MFS transporter, DHA1 family, inner membrane transport protein
MVTSLKFKTLLLKLRIDWMSSETPTQLTPKTLPKKWFLLALAIATFSTGLANATLSLFTTNIAKTFYDSIAPVAVGSVTQLGTINMAAEVIGALIFSVLAIRFRHKRLLLFGTGLIIASSIVGYLSPDMLTLQLSYAIEGVGSIIIGVIAMALIADSLPQGQRAKVISYLFSIGAVATLVMIPIVGLLTETGGWRFGLVALMLPTSLLGLILTFFMVPSKPVCHNQSNGKNPYVESFRQIIKSRSATACLLANLLTIAGTEVAIFALAFYRTQFGASTAQRVMIYETAVFLFILAPLVSSRLIPRYGAKRIAVISTSLAAIFTGLFFFVPNFWVAFSLDMFHVWFAAMSVPAFAVLVLEQLPNYRATVFSLNSLFNNIGKVLAPLIGGTLLIVSAGAYGTVGFVLGGTTIVGCAILFLAVKDTGEI